MTNIPPSERVNWIGASEVAGLLNLSPWTTPWQLYHQKRGTLATANLDDDARVNAGRFIEPAIGAWANHHFGWDIENEPAYLRHPRVARFGCSLDFRSQSTGEPVEIKNVDGLIFRDKWEAEGDELIDAPVQYLVQLQAQLAVTGAESGWLLACAGGNRLARMRVERHEAMIARIEREVETFWRRVEDGDEPKPDFTRDVSALAELYSSSRGAPIDLTHSNELPAACAGYLKAKAEERAAKARAEVWRAEILAAVRDAPGAICQGFLIQLSDVAETTIPATTRRAYRRLTVKED